MPDLRNVLAQMFAPQQASSFEDLLRQERGDRDTAALRWNAMQGNPGSTAYGGAPAGAFPPAPDPMITGAVPTPTQRPDLPVPAPDQAILEDRATRDRSMVPSPAGPAEVGTVVPSQLPKGKITMYGDARRGQVGKVKPGKKPAQFRLTS